jgi:hypothetical protein
MPRACRGAFLLKKRARPGFGFFAACCAVLFYAKTANVLAQRRNNDFVLFVLQL